MTYCILHSDKKQCKWYIDYLNNNKRKSGNEIPNPCQNCVYKIIIEAQDDEESAIQH